MQYKKGQWLECTEDNSHGFTQGKYYKVTGVYTNGRIAIMDDGGYVLVNTQNFIDQHFKPAPKTWQTLEVGDGVIDSGGHDRTVLEVSDNSFLISYVDNKDAALDWYTFKEVEKDGWTIKGAEPQDNIVELTLEEVAKLKGIDVSKLRIKE